MDKLDKVFVVARLDADGGGYHDWANPILGVFSTFDKAEKAAKREFQEMLEDLDTNEDLAEYEIEDFFSIEETPFDERY